MKDNELIEILKEFDEKRVEQLNDNARKLFNAIMSIADERDRLLEEKQELTNYLKEKIEKLHNDTSGLYGGVVYEKIESYKEILMIIEKSESNEIRFNNK